MKWFVRWNSTYRQYEVMLGGFRDGLFGYRYQAIERRDKLNADM